MTEAREATRWCFCIGAREFRNAAAEARAHCVLPRGLGLPPKMVAAVSGGSAVRSVVHGSC